MTAEGLTDFLLARIAEDETEAPHVLVDGGTGDLYSHSAHVLAECEAKRRIVEGYETYRAQDDQETPRVLFSVCRFLALPYADHPDYREEWKP